MFRRILIGTSIVSILVLCALPAWGQISDTYPGIGVRVEYSVIAVEGTIETAGISILGGDSPQVFDVSTLEPVGPAVNVTTVAYSILPLEMVPFDELLADWETYGLLEETKAHLLEISDYALKVETEDYVYYLCMRGSTVTYWDYHGMEQMIATGQLRTEALFSPLMEVKADVQWLYSALLQRPTTPLGGAGCHTITPNIDGSPVVVLTPAGAFDTFYWVRDRSYEMPFILSGDMTSSMNVSCEDHQWTGTQRVAQGETRSTGHSMAAASVQEIHISPVVGIPELSEGMVLTQVAWLTGLSGIDGDTPISGGLDKNFALDAVSAMDDRGKDAPVTDGTIVSPGEWNSRTTAVIGKYVEIDLGKEVAIDRIRILAGDFLEARRKPEFYIKGYRISVAPADDPGNWVVVAEQAANTNQDVDTSTDGTWLQTDDQGLPLPTIGRYVKTEIITEDGVNWVVIGEIEVYGQEVDGLSGRMLPTSVESASWGQIKATF